MAQTKTTKQPQDHKPKQTGSIESFEIEGITVTPPEGIEDDFEFIEDLAAADAGDGMAGIRAMRRLMGDAYPKVKELARDPKTGQVSAEKITGYFQEAMEKSAAKN